jgi:hypothetical protein
MLLQMARRSHLKPISQRTSTSNWTMLSLLPALAVCSYAKPHPRTHAALLSNPVPTTLTRARLPLWAPPSSYHQCPTQYCQRALGWFRIIVGLEGARAEHFEAIPAKSLLGQVPKLEYVQLPLPTRSSQEQVSRLGCK